MTVLAIDQGTSGTKAIVVDPDQGVLGLAEVPVHPVYLADGGVEQDPQALLDSVVEAGRRALAAAGRPAEVVSLANQGETVLAWDPATGRPLSQAVVWQDGRAAGICQELADRRDLVESRTGLALEAYFSAPKMAWLRRNVTTSGVVTTTDSWLLHQLTGEFVTDVTTASRSLVLDLDRREWDAELLDVFGLAAEPLPRIVACDEPLGTTGLFGDELVVGGQVVDQQAALFAQGCLAPGQAKCTFGTGAFLLVNTGRAAPRSRNGLTTSVAWTLRGASDYCLDGQVFTVASAVRWLTDIGLIDGPAHLDPLAADGAGDAVCVPALAGLAAPWWRGDARASFAGIGLATTRGNLVAAVLQGIAAQIAELAEVVEHDLGEPLSVLRVDGGLTRSRELMQATADLCQIPIEVYASPHATALGAAAMGRLATQPELAPADVVGAGDPSGSYLPRWSADQAAGFRSRWRRLAERNLEEVNIGG
ncbi:FGGY family carbohydrate kinase [Brooklawnia cerclae]|uniref:ATP:glycerol 3-phosphotransferase n=1 Tax=Brooklawnia cerclae TaxID=349934 RepID=A0ABX0SGR0_9ACTN|nr:FGGY family carbohydrate kinase [Brooklawnia cerclae]NIH57575.1 glycerol kinase [Brooklawnia cerclae]